MTGTSALVAVFSNLLCTSQRFILRLDGKIFPTDISTVITSAQGFSTLNQVVVKNRDECKGISEVPGLFSLSAWVHLSSIGSITMCIIQAPPKRA